MPYDLDVIDHAGGPAEPLSGHGDGVTLAERLVEIAAELGPDELRVLVLVAERLRIGRRRYGELRLDGDPRDWRREALDEAADGLVYAACGLVRGSR